jgi:hypothetical protein
MSGLRVDSVCNMLGFAHAMELRLMYAISLRRSFSTTLEYFGSFTCIRNKLQCSCILYGVCMERRQDHD